MTRPTVHLTERMPRELRLPVEDVRFLLTHAQHLLEVIPTFRHGVYRLTPRGVIGYFEGPSCRFAVRPKVPWPTLRLLLGLSQNSLCSKSEVEPDAGLFDSLAMEFTERLQDVIKLGLVPGYCDVDTETAFLRGKLRAADQLRYGAARAFPDRFHVTESTLDLNTPWNRIPRAIVERLLSSPDLGSGQRIKLYDADKSLAEVPLATLTEADFAAADAEPRASHYRPLLSLCRHLHDGFTAASFPGVENGAFLIDLSRAFEKYVAKLLSTELTCRRRWSVEAQPRFEVGSAWLQPDILVRFRGEPMFVLDAKWKLPGSSPQTSDLHQVLAHASVTGAKRVGLVYPGSRFGFKQLGATACGVQVSLFRVQVVGTTDACNNSAARLARAIRRRNT